MIQPAESSDMPESKKMCSEVFHELKIIINRLGYSAAVGDVGGFAPDFTKMKKH